MNDLLQFELAIYLFLEKQKIYTPEMLETDITIITQWQTGSLIYELIFDQPQNELPHSPKQYDEMYLNATNLTALKK